MVLRPFQTFPLHWLWFTVPGPPLMAACHKPSRSQSCVSNSHSRHHYFHLSTRVRPALPSPQVLAFVFCCLLFLVRRQRFPQRHRRNFSMRGLMSLVRRCARIKRATRGCSRLQTGSSVPSYTHLSSDPAQWNLVVRDYRYKPFSLTTGCDEGRHLGSRNMSQSRASLFLWSSSLLQR